MSYYTSFKLKGELDTQFRPLFGTSNESKYINKYENVLFAICMEDRTNYTPEDYSKLYDTLERYVNMYINLLLSDYWSSLQNELKNNNSTIEFYGWQYCKSSFSPLYESKEDFIAKQASMLFRTAIIKCDNYWDKDSTYNCKYTEVLETIDGIKEITNDFASESFIKFYREHPELADEDGDDTESIDESNEDSSVN